MKRYTLPQNTPQMAQEYGLDRKTAEIFLRDIHRKYGKQVTLREALTASLEKVIRLKDKEKLSKAKEMERNYTENEWTNYLNDIASRYEIENRNAVSDNKILGIFSDYLKASEVLKDTKSFSPVIFSP